VARLDSREEPALTATELVPLIERTVERQRVRAPRLSFEVTGDRDVVADVDVDGYAEAIGNLLDNAARHARQRVDVHVGRSNGVVAVEIGDDGPGIPADARERVFDRFVSLDGGPGSGLGLPIARGIAEAHGGSLEYDGGSFVLRVPRRQGHSSL